MARKAIKLNRHETTVARVAQVINAGHVLCAYNALASEDTTVGPYHEAVDRGVRFAVIGVRGRATEQRVTTASEAADWFVERVGSSRANEAAKAGARKHSIALAH